MENTLSIPNNSRAAFEPLRRYIEYSALFPPLSQNSVELQSSSVTITGSLWQQSLARRVAEDLPLVLRQRQGRADIDYDIEQKRRNSALIQLLRSWREGDEQEQRDTWTYLKQALDEDRLSDRKLFP